MTAIAGFEGSYLGDAGKIADDTRLECKICWHVYDPAKGCEAWQVPAGTPFSRLPTEWRCPNCDAPPSGFMAIDPVVAESHTPAPVISPFSELGGRQAVPEDGRTKVRLLAGRFEAAFNELYRGRMRDVPFLNRALNVQAVGFRQYADKQLGDCTLGILITPWFLNIVMIPDDPTGTSTEIGGKSLIVFPSGTYEFIWCDRPEIGRYCACSLFSPPAELSSQLMAVDVAVSALEALFDEAQREEGARSAEIRALRISELERAQQPGAMRQDAQSPGSSVMDGAAAGLSPGKAPEPTRRALFLPQRSGEEAST